ncbi:ABC transporter substrate-binding protein [Eoetvoesiella caeni]|uniref:Branched-chain amino acid transport system substrate-binding protein n=1 Tax=Eoetvoesiella caeni TaxID=645616 RepID=A0A366HLS6_9BURK|nr:ABC transporter substrate-binding protein [Eoetvoesiella caeni]MCI2807432.1 ABC transporter substrate-binding protein [Eoetvoesiella caeni]NYT53173.1 ABC transporter substrate-binding protein [Eoetvoesiella caeni]RBP43151.1 branched-chain amino acid transport system substrate-binding protein [Eoetvoesiella caeni]
MKKVFHASLLAAALGFAVTQANAEITIGVDLSLTGPASGLGIPVNSGFALWPDNIAGEKVKFITLDDGSDPAKAQKNAQRLISEDKVDVIIGSSTTTPAIAMGEVAAEGKTVQLAAAPAEFPEGKGTWTFRLPQSTAVMAGGVIDHMKKIGVKSFAFIGYGDAYGESWLKELTKLADKEGIKITDVERYARADTSVTAQALKAIASKPDAILIVASGSGSAMPHTTVVERGFKGKIYQTHSAASRDLIRLGGKAVEGSFVVSGLAVLPEGLPASHPSKKIATDFVNAYEKKYGAGTRNQFAAHAYDAYLILSQVVPVALKSGKPGTQEFRTALKNALETHGSIPITQGVITYTKDDHFGFDKQAQMMLTIKDGAFAAAD